MFKGLCAFPLTPFNAKGIDEHGFIKLLSRLVNAQVDSLGILGSTGSYAYLSCEQRKRVITLAKQYSNKIPLMTCVGATSTDEILRLTEDAQEAGADALMLPVVSYQPLTDDEAFKLFETVSQHTSIPICVYDNPSTTHFTFSHELYGYLTALPNVKSIKIPGILNTPLEESERITRIRSFLNTGVSIGISGDASAGLGLNAGCDVWYSVCGGLFPNTAKDITEAARMKNDNKVTELTSRLEPLWTLFRKHKGSIRVISAAAGVLGLTDIDCLPRPIYPLNKDDIAEIYRIIKQLNLA